MKPQNAPSVSFADSAPARGGAATGETKIRRSEFGVSYGLPAVGDEVTLRLEAEFKAAGAPKG